MPPSRTNSINATDYPFADYPKTKRPVVRATASQLSELNKAFQETTRPTVEAREELAERTGLTSTWVNSWFVRERKKRATIAIEKDTDIIRGITGSLAPEPKILPRHPSVVSESSTTAMTAPTSRGASITPSLTSNIEWFEPYSRPYYSARSPSPSLPATHTVAFPPNPNQSYIQPHMPYNSAPTYHGTPHTTAFSSQSIISTISTSTSSFSTALPSPQSQVQYPPYVPHPLHFYKHQQQPIPLAPNHLQSYYSYNARSMNSSRGLPPLQTAVAVDRIKALESSTSYGQRVAGYLSTQERPLFAGAEETSISGSESLNMKEESESSGEGAQEDNADAMGSETEEEATPYMGPTDVSHAAAYRVLNDAADAQDGSDAPDGLDDAAADKHEAKDAFEAASTPMSQAEAWKKAQQHPEFETLLKIAGVHVGFKLTDDGVTHER